MNRRAFVALGSNLGDRWEYLRLGISMLPDVFATSPVYETEPVGGPGDQGPFLNMVTELRTNLSAHEILAAAQAAEAAAGRQRDEVNGPRTLDVDVLLVGGEHLDTPELQIPHPRMWNRRFVLQPLADLAPELLPERWEADAIGTVQAVGNL